MQQVIMKRLFIAGIALLTVPTTILAQQGAAEKDKKAKKDLQQITIVRSVDVQGKTVIEIDGDKIKVNGKDVKEDKDVTVHVNNIKSSNVYRMGDFNRNWTFSGDNVSLFSEDANRAMLGVTTEDDAKGAEITTITKESAAEKAGLKKGDVITKIGDDAIEDADDVSKTVRDHKPGDKVTVTFLREGKEQKVTTELGKWKGIPMTPRFEMSQLNAVTPPEVALAYGNGNNSFYFGGRPRLGMSIQDTEEGKGVKVLEVEDDGSAAKAGIKEDDVILSVDDKETNSTDDVTKIIRDSKEKYNFNFKVQRGGKTQTIEVKLPKRLKTTDL